jgi:large subunit ribosomal protein L18
MKVKTKDQARQRRHFRIRRKLSGTADRPRMAVYVSNKHVYVQVINDETSVTLVSASSMEKDLQQAKNTRDTAKEIGKRAGERAKEQGITSVVFDRGGFAYGVRIQALADAARETGLKF